MSANKGPVSIRFGHNLRHFRRRAGFSQEALAERALVHRSVIGLLERGARTPRVDTLITIATCLSVEPGALLEGIEWERPEVDQAVWRRGGAPRARHEGFKVVEPAGSD